MPTPPKHDWTKIVSESNGNRIFLPTSFKGAQEDLEKIRKAYNADAVKMAEREIRMTMATQNMFFELREHLAKNGQPDIWVKDIGFEQNALDEGVFIVNISEKR